MQEQGLQVTTSAGGLPPVNPKFQSPALAAPYQPDYSKYAPELGQQLRRAVERAIYD